jgi:hypothetical protein
MANWYYSRENQACGPVNENQIIDLLSAGELQVFDLVFRDGEQRWRVISECPELGLTSTALSTDATVTYGTTEREWVVLRASDKRTPLGVRYVQVGPYASFEVLQQLHRGELAFADYAWKAGYKRWIRLSQIRDFDQHPHETPSSEAPESQVSESLTVQVQSQVQLDDIFTHVIAEPTFTESTPPAEPPPSAEFAQTHEKSNDVQVAPEEVLQAAAKPTRPPRQVQQVQMRSRILFAAAAAVAAMFLITYGLRQVKTMPSAEPTAVPAAPRVVAMSSPSAPEIVAIELSGAHPQLAFNTTAKVGEPIQVEIAAQTGQILNLPSYDFQQTITRANGETPTLDLSTLKLPIGTYDITLRVGAQVAHSTVFVGRDSADFQQNLAAYRKQIEFIQKKELAEIGAVTARFTASFANLQQEYVKRAAQPTEWASFYKEWTRVWQDWKSDSLDKVNVQNRNDFAYPGFWLELTALRTAIYAQAQSFQQAVQEGRAPASQLNEDIPARLGQLRMQLANTARN